MLCLATLMMVLDGTIVNVALPVIQRDLGFTSAGLAWVVNAYLLTFGGFMLLGGRAGDLFGRRRMMLLGIALFTLASLLCGVSTSQAMLIGARALQGIGGSIATAVSLSVLLAVFSDQGERAKAMSVWGFVGSGGGTVGVLLGGLLTESLDWHWVFLINLPLGALVLLFGRSLLPELPGARTGARLDVLGVIGVVLAPLLAMYGILNGGQQGWGEPVTLACLAAAAAVLMAFVAVERRVKAPIMPLRVFRSRTVVVTNLLSVLNAVAFFGWFFFSPLYVQGILGHTSLETGMSFVPAMFTMAVLSLGVTARVVGRFGPKRPMVTGMVLMTGGLLLFARTPLAGQMLVDVVPAMVLLGLGAGLCFMPLVLTATSEADPAEGGLLSGLLSMSQFLGGAVGLAALATVALGAAQASAGGGEVTPQALLDGYHAAFLVAAALSFATTVIAFTQLRDPAVHRRRMDDTVPGLD